MSCSRSHARRHFLPLGDRSSTDKRVRQAPGQLLTTRSNARSGALVILAAEVSALGAERCFLVVRWQGPRVGGTCSLDGSLSSDRDRFWFSGISGRAIIAIKLEVLWLS